MFNKLFGGVRFGAGVWLSTKLKWTSSGRKYYERYTVDIFMKSYGRRRWFGVNERKAQCVGDHKIVREEGKKLELCVEFEFEVEIYLTVCFTNQRSSRTVRCVSMDGVWAVWALVNDATVWCVTSCVFFRYLPPLEQRTRSVVHVFYEKQKKQKKIRIWFFGLPLSLMIACQVVDGRAW